MKIPHADKIKDYDYELVQELWEDCIRYNVEFKDPFHSATQDDYCKAIDHNKAQIEMKKSLATEGKFRVIPDLSFIEF